MSVNRRQRRQQERNASRHFDALGKLLMDFYEFLERKPQPSDEEVRRQFINHDQRWKNYCISHNLTAEISQLFKEEVSVSWKKRYSKPSSTTK